MVNQGNLSRRAQWAGGHTIVSQLMAKSLAHPELISLAAGFVDQETLPVEPTRKALEALWSDPGRARAALQYGTTIGHPPLRQAVLDRMVRADGATARELNLSLQQVVVTAGSNQLLHLVSDILLDPGDIVICGAPTYFVYMGTLGNLGVRTIGVETDQDGLIPEAIEDELGRLDRGRRVAAGEGDLRGDLLRQSQRRERAGRSPRRAGRAGQALVRAGEDLPDRRRGLSGTPLLGRRRAQPAVVRPRGRHGDPCGDVFQVLFAGHPRGLGDPAAGSCSQRPWRRKATSTSAPPISTRS